MGEASTRRMEFLDSFRVLAVFMVVGVHTFGYVGYERTSIISVLHFVVVKLGAPAFFMIDGFLFSNKQIESVQFQYKDYLLKSSRRLILPWAVFTVIYTVLQWVFETTGVLPTKSVKDTIHTFIEGATLPQGILDLSQCIYSIYASIIAPHLYFLPSLFLIRTLSILSRHLAYGRTWTAIAALGGYTFLFRNFFGYQASFFGLPGWDPVLHAFWGMQYYLLGIVIFKLRDRIKIVHCVVALGAVVFLVGFEVVRPRSFIPIDYILLVCAFLSLGTYTKRPTIISNLGKDAMGIYLLHLPFALQAMLSITSSVISNHLAVFVMVWLSTFLFALSLTRSINRLPHGNVIFGEALKRETRTLKHRL